jgi:hypothetical protein
MSDRHALNVLQVASPCDASWDQMSGDAQRRFCTHCNKFVHDLSAMPTDQAEKLVCESAGSLCVRFARDARTGAVLTLDYRPPPRRPSRARGVAVIASILAAMSFAATWAAYRVLRKPALPVPTMIMGDIAMPPRPTPAGK